MGITALAAFASEISAGNTMSCVISYGTSQSTVEINKDNSLVLQSVEVFPIVHNYMTVINKDLILSLASQHYQIS